MAHKNKLFLGTNKDTYIAADEAGNIVFVNENGSEAMLTSEGLMQKASGENSFAAVGTGTSEVTTSTPTLVQTTAAAGVVDLAAKFPTAKLVAEGQADVFLSPTSTPRRGATLDKVSIDFYDDIRPTKSLSQVEMFAENSSKYFDSFSFSLPAVAWDPYIEWTLEVDFKHILTSVSVGTMDYYAPDYQTFNYPTSISKVVAKNVVVSSEKYLPVQVNGYILDPYAEIEALLESDKWIGIQQPFGYNGGQLPNNLQITNLSDAWPNMIMASYISSYGLNIPQLADNSPYEISLANLKAYSSITVEQNDPYDPYAIAWKITEFPTEPIQGGGVSYYRTTYSPTVFPIIWAKPSPWNDVVYRVYDCAANEDSWEALYQATKETLKYVSAQDISIYWYSNNYDLGYEDMMYYETVFTDSRAVELANLGVYIGLG